MNYTYICPESTLYSTKIKYDFTSYSYLFTFSERLPFGNGLKRMIYFNDRLACAKGISPKNDLDGGCSIFRNYCCNKTYLEVAKWDFEIRGKCIVLRSLKTTVCT